MFKNTIQNDLIKTHRKQLSEKTERIVTGLYLVSSLIDDKEPLKWTLREKALETLSAAHKGLEKEVVSFCEDMSDLVSLAHRSALMSPMNAELLSKGLRVVLESIASGGMLESNFLQLPEEQEVRKESVEQKPTETQSVKDNFKNTEKTVIHKRQDTPNKRTSSRKDKRKDKVLEALGKKEDSSIKDIARQVKGCSEKTIQRELNSLIGEGLVNKKGERRWSVYSLS